MVRPSASISASSAAGNDIDDRIADRNDFETGGGGHEKSCDAWENMPRALGGARAKASATLDDAAPAAPFGSMARAVQALFLAIGDLSSPRVLRILAISLALTLLLFIAAGAALLAGARWALAHWLWLGAAGIDMASVLILLLLIAGSWLLFRAVAIVVVGLFADAIVADVEGPPLSRRRGRRGRCRLAAVGRPRARIARAPDPWQSCRAALLYPPPGDGNRHADLALFVNALLLGRDLEAMVLARHPGRPRLERRARWSLGLLSAASFLVPVANLLAPIASAAMAVHMLHLRRADR
ncbi:EI24 domain-containing protein [Sphingopyxis terrae]|uniref:EI24 domain-containing protein n=1 Tax=Sphingopyxis terrae TaxID=33052 RepID=UPI00363D6929